jgi:Arc/MetJ-type ribon-helix-helix transcriptional regulator
LVYLKYISAGYLAVYPSKVLDGLAKTQVNVKLEEQLLREVERLVESGTYATKTEAFTEALKLLLRIQRGRGLLQKIDKIRQGTETLPSASRALREVHEKEEN